MFAAAIDFLLSTRKFTDAEQLLDSEMLESLSIAEVVRVNPDNAELRITRRAYHAWDLQKRAAVLVADNTSFIRKLN